MVKILVKPESLMALSSQLQRTAGDVRALESRLSNVLASLDWEVRHKAGIDSKWHSARSSACTVAQRLEDMARYLNTKARAFQDTDRQGVGGMDKIIGAYVTAVREWIMSPYGRINSYPQRIIDDLLRLGLLGALVAVPTATVFALPALIPAIVNSIKPLLPISPSIKPLEKPSQKPPQKPPVQPPQKPPEKPPVKPPVSVETGKPGAMKASDKLVSFIANYESFSATPYRGADSQNRTIGYGHVIKPGENYERLTEEQARELLKKDIEYFVDKVNALTKDISLTQQQFDALVDFAYNCGEGALARSTLLKDIKGGVATDEKLKADFEAWCKCNGKTLLGLWRRRIDEWEMWKSGDYARNYYKR